MATKEPKDPEAEKARFGRAIAKEQKRLLRELEDATSEDDGLREHGAVVLTAIEPLVTLLAIGGSKRYGGATLSIVRRGPEIHFELIDTKNIEASYLRIRLGVDGIRLELFAVTSPYAMEHPTTQRVFEASASARETIVPTLLEAASVHGVAAVLADPGLLGMVAGLANLPRPAVLERLNERVVMSGIHVGTVSEDGWQPILEKKKTRMS